MTVAQVAAVMLVAARTVVKWTDEKILPCRMLPLSEHRRIRLDDLVKFARLHGYTDEEVMSRVRGLAAGGGGGGS